MRLLKSFEGQLKAVLTGLTCLALLGSFVFPPTPAMADSDNMLMISIASVPKSGNAKTVHAKVLIDAPPALVWEALTDYSRMSDILPGYEKSRVLQSSGSRKLLDVAMKVSAFLPTYEYQVSAQEQAKDYRLSLTRVSGDFKSLNAVYKLIPQNRGKSTLLTYHLQLDPGFTLPGAQALIRSNTEKCMKAMEAHVEREYHKSEIGQR